MKSQKMRLAWQNGLMLLLAVVWAAGNVIAKSPAKPGAPRSHHAQQKYGVASGADQVLSAVYDPSSNSLRVEGAGTGSGSGAANALQFGTSAPISLSTSAPSSGQVLEFNGTNFVGATISGAGTVTSVGLTAPAIFTLSGSPINSSGTFTLGLTPEGANLVFAGPSSGSSAAPAFRALVAADVPALNYQAPVSTYAAPANEFLTGFTAPNTFTAAQPSFANLSGAATLGQLPATLAQFTGTITANDCAKWSASGVLTDAGAACGSGGSLVFETNSAPNSSSSLLNLANGTNITFSNTSGGTVTASVTGTLATSAIPAINLAASGNGGVTGALGFANGGTGQTTLGSSGQCLGTNGTAMVWQACGSGGSATTIQVNGATAASQSPINFQSGGYITVSNPSAGNIQFNFVGPLSVANGGTGLTTLGSSGQCLGTNGTAMVWQSCGSGSGAMSIGGAVSASTNQAVLYINSSNQLAQDETNFNWNDSAKTLTVGNIVLNGGSASQTLTLPTAAMSVGPGSAISLGSNTGNVPSISANGGTVTPIAPLNGDLSGSWTAVQVGTFHLTGDGNTQSNAIITQVPNDTANTAGQTQTFNATGSGTVETFTVVSGFQPFEVGDLVSPASCGGYDGGSISVTAATSTTFTLSGSATGSQSGCIVTSPSYETRASNVVTMRIYPQPFSAGEAVLIAACNDTTFEAAYPLAITAATAGSITYTLAGSSTLTTACTASSGTENEYLAKANPTGAKFATTSDTAIPTFIVASGGGSTGDAHFANTGQAQCVMDATASNTEGETVVASTAAAAECDATATPGSSYVIGYMISNSTTAGGAATVGVGLGYSGGSGGGLSGLTTNAVMKATSATSIGSSALTDNGTDVSSTEPVGIPSGTLAAPSLYFTASTGTGISFSSTNGEMILGYGGSEGAAVFGNGIDLGAASRLVFGASFDNVMAGLSADADISSSVPIIDVGTGGPANTAGDLVGNGFGFALTNATTTGTSLNTLTKLTGAPSTAVIAATTDTSGVVGITIAGIGTSSSARIISSGLAKCVFDGATTAGDYVQISSATAGDCHDAGTTLPASGEIIGRVLSTNAAAGTYQINETIMNASSGGASGPSAFTTLTYTSGGNTTWLPSAAATIANAEVTATHATSTTFVASGLVNGGVYHLVILQDSTGGGVTFTLGTTGSSCAHWYVAGGGSGAITLTSAANGRDLLAFTFDGTNCYASLNSNFN